MSEKAIVDCTEITIRLILRAKDVSPDGDVRAGAFLLRPKDCGKLSVFRRSRGSFEEYTANFNKVLGSRTLHTGHIRQIGLAANLKLDVVPDEIDFQVGHAAIIGLPDPEVNVAEAEYIAGLLRDHCR